MEHLVIASGPAWGFGVGQDQSSADGTGKAPKGINGRVWRAAIFQAAKSRLVDAGDLGHGRQSEASRLPRFFQIVKQDPNKEVGAALHRAFIVARRLQLLLGWAMQELLADGFVAGSVGRGPLRCLETFVGHRFYRSDKLPACRLSFKRTSWQLVPTLLPNRARSYSWASSSSRGQR